jgi:hypothetical protein
VAHEHLEQGELPGREIDAPVPDRRSPAEDVELDATDAEDGDLARARGAQPGMNAGE